ncbi:MAG: hypothetical protein IPG45_24205 [Deltaproteobacteria bacterium]|nr:hypothetical protein [Deltaproteobacteria bacterium]
MKLAPPWSRTFGLALGSYGVLLISIVTGVLLFDSPYPRALSLLVGGLAVLAPLVPGLRAGGVGGGLAHVAAIVAASVLVLGVPGVVSTVAGQWRYLGRVGQEVMLLLVAAYLVYGAIAALAAWALGRRLRSRRL